MGIGLRASGASGSGVSAGSDAPEPADGRARRSAPGRSRHYRTQEVVGALGVTRRQLQYWAKTGLVVPSARTPGGHHRYGFSDLIAVKATKRLIDAGVSVQRIRRCLEALAQRLPAIERPLEELVIVATGDVLLVIEGAHAYEALSGQEWVFEVAQLAKELAAFDDGGRCARAPGADGAATRVEPVRRARAVRTERRQQTAG